MPVDIKLNLDDKEANRKYDEMLKKWRDKSSKSETSPGEVASRSFEKGAAAGSLPSHDLAELERGAFYESFKSKLDLLKGSQKKLAEVKKKNAKDGSDGKEEAAPGGAGSFPGLSSHVQSLTVASAEFQKVIMPSQPGGIPGTGGQGGGGDSEETGRAGLMSRFSHALTAIPFAGAALSALTGGAGFAMKLMSSMGEQWVNAMRSQQGTLNVMGGYVGGGGGFFHNAEMAGGALTYARERGQGAYGRGNEIVGELNRNQWTAFAASQGAPISMIAEAAGKLMRDAPGLKLDSLRGYMKEAKIPILKQGEIVERFGQYVGQMREAGYGGMSEAGIQRMFAIASGMQGLKTPERAFAITRSMDEQVRGTTDSPLGQVALSGLIGKYGLDKAMKMSEEGMQNEEVRKVVEGFLSRLDETSRGFLMKEWGISSYTEGSTLTGRTGQGTTPDAMQVNPKGNILTAATNRREEAFIASKAAERIAVDVALETQEKLLRMMEKNEKLLFDTARVIDFIQDKTVSGLSKVTASIGEIYAKLTAGQ